MNSVRGTVKATINGLSIVVDARSGCILSLSYPGPGKLLESDPARAGVIDIAYPIPEFEPLRLAGRFSDQARVENAPGALTIHWDRLGPSRTNYALTGAVSATVRFAAHSDGRSVVMSAEVVNESKVEVRQILFPDFSGLLPFCGESGTLFRSGGSQSSPFLDLKMTEEKESAQFMEDSASLAVEHKSGSLYGTDMITRWMDFGGLNGGFSVFPKAWGWDPQVDIRLQRSEVEAKLRMSYVHYVDLKAGGTWRSPEYVLTPHKNGWAAGIGPFRDWVKAHYTRVVPVPKHVREGLGFRSVWMCQNRPSDPHDLIFKFSDLPALARESKEHGLDELVYWAWSDFFTLPLPPPYPHLGSEKDMANAVAACKKLGVNVAPFVSVLIQNAASAPRYDVRVEGGGGWTYHTELIPRFNPPYAHGSATVQVGPTDRLWQEDVLAGLRHLADIGIPSLCWDQVWATADPEPNQASLLRRVREQAHRVDSESTLGGEELLNMEIDSAFLDYTWNWQGYIECAPLTTVLPAPRINCCISSSPLVVKKAFADNLYLNVMPRKLESINGSDWIASRPALSKALKQCAKLRCKFLRYFVDGTLIGDCIYYAPCPGAHTCAYTLGDRALVVLVNLGKRRMLNLPIDSGPWLQHASKRAIVREFDGEGHLISSTEHATRGRVKTHPLGGEEIAIIEIVAKPAK